MLHLQMLVVQVWGKEWSGEEKESYSVCVILFSVFPGAGIAQWLELQTRD